MRSMAAAQHQKKGLSHLIYGPFDCTILNSQIKTTENVCISSVSRALDLLTSAISLRRVRTLNRLVFASGTHVTVAFVASFSGRFPPRQ